MSAVFTIHSLAGSLPVHLAAASTITPPTDAPSFVLHLSWQQILTALIYVVLPLLVALITKTTSSATTRSLVLAGLSAVGGILTGILTAVTTGTPFDITGAFGTALLGFTLAVGSHFGIWKGTSLPDVLKSIGSSQVKLATAGDHEATSADAETSPDKAPVGD